MTDKNKQWSLNTKRYLFGLGLIEEAYKLKKINLKQKRDIEKRLDKQFEINYWKMNPNLESPLLKEILLRVINTYEIVDSSS